MISFLQINLNCCQIAQDLMDQIAAERRADIVIVSEQYQNQLCKWYSGTGSRAAIYVPSSQLRVTDTGSSATGCWTWVEFAGLRVYSCYFSPNAPLDEFNRALGALEDSVRSAAGPVVVAGDFNAKAPEWGSARSDRRGSMLCEMTSHLRLHAVNTGGAYTFVRGATGSVIDVTFADESTVGRIQQWQVLDIYSHSDHQYLSFNVSGMRPHSLCSMNPGWAVRSLDGPALDVLVAVRGQRVKELANRGAGAEEVVGALSNLQRDAAMPQCLDVVLKLVGCPSTDGTLRSLLCVEIAPPAVAGQFDTLDAMSDAESIRMQGRLCVMPFRRARHDAGRSFASPSIGIHGARRTGL